MTKRVRLLTCAAKMDAAFMSCACHDTQCQALHAAPDSKQQQVKVQVQQADGVCRSCRRGTAPP